VRYALSPGALAELARFVQNRPLLAFDIDGTLAPIVSRPWDARVSQTLQEELSRLAARARVAVLTGRAVADAKGMLGFTPAYLVGNHGAEGVPGGERAAAAFARICSSWLATLADTAEAWRETHGVALEDKVYSLAFHYRHAEDPARARSLILQRVARLDPCPVIIHGKLVVNLLAPGAPHKGDAMMALLAHCGCNRGVYIGDDVTDEDVFRLREPAVLTVRVEHEPGSAADMYVKGQHEVERFVHELNKMVSAPNDNRMASRVSSRAGR